MNTNSIPLDEHYTYESFLKKMGFGYAGECAAILELYQNNKVVKYAMDLLFTAAKDMRGEALDLNLQLEKAEAVIDSFEKVDPIEVRKRARQYRKEYPKEVSSER